MKKLYLSGKKIKIPITHLGILRMFLTVGGGASVAISSSNYRALSSAVGVRPGIGFTYRRGYAYPSLGTPAVLDGASC